MAAGYGVRERDAGGCPGVAIEIRAPDTARDDVVPRGGVEGDEGGAGLGHAGLLPWNLICPKATVAPQRVQAKWMSQRSLGKARRSVVHFVQNRHGESEMRTVSATEAKQGLAGVIEAARREPVIIQRQKRDVAVVLSPAEYQRLVRLNIDEFQRFCDQVGQKAESAGLTQEKLDQLLADD